MEGKKSWIDSFITQPKGRLLLRIPDAYIRCAFENPEDSAILIDSVEGENLIAESLYAQVHAKYVLTPEGMEQIHQLYQNHTFMTCPRTYCHGTQCIPHGVSSEFGAVPLKMLCPFCKEIYNCVELTDGSAYGPNWASKFVEQFNPPCNGEEMIYEPRVFGFRLDPDALDIHDGDYLEI